MPISKIQLEKLQEIQLNDACILYLLRITKPMQDYHNDFYTQEKLDHRKKLAMYATRNLLYQIETDPQSKTSIEIINMFDSHLVLHTDTDVKQVKKDHISVDAFVFPFFSKSAVDDLINMNVQGFVKLEELFNIYVHASLANEGSQELLCKSRLVREAVRKNQNITYVDFGDTDERMDYPICSSNIKLTKADKKPRAVSKNQLQKLGDFQLHDAVYWFDYYIDKIPSTLNRDHKRHARKAIRATRRLLYLIETEAEHGTVGPIEMMTYKKIPIVLRVEEISQVKVTIKARVFPYFSKRAVDALLNTNIEEFVKQMDSCSKDVHAILGPLGTGKLLNTSRLVREAIMKHPKMVSAELRDAKNTVTYSA